MCWCDSSIRTPCCGKPECFPKEGKSKIQIIKQQIENLQKELKTEQDNCLHQNVMYDTGANTGNYDPSSDCYWNNVWDPLNFKIEVDGECVYGYKSPTRLSGTQEDFTLHLQFTSTWNMALKDKVGEYVAVRFYYKNNDEYYTMFHQTMRVKDHKLSFEHEIPTANVRFTLKKENK